jgi:hypothetical protein
MPTPSPFNSTRTLIEAFYGFPIGLSIKETSLTVGTTAVAAGTQGAQRAAITFGNCGANLIVVGFSTGVTATSGMPVPTGGFLSFNWYIDGEACMYQFYAISGTAAQTLYVCESVLSVVN